MIDLPPEFVETITKVHGQKGILWLENFNQLIEFCETKWEFKVLKPFPLSYNFVAPVVGLNKSSAVLKLGVPGKEQRSELAALKAFQGNGVCQLIDSDEKRGIFLLKHIKPGTSLATVGDEEQAIAITARIIKQLQATNISDTAAFPSIEQWAQGLTELRKHFHGQTGPIPESLVQRAERLYPELWVTIQTPRLLHGDLHQGNILQASQEQWIAIDPKGLIGETEYEIIPFLLNNLPTQNAESVIRKRIHLFAEWLALDKSRILSWAFCHAVLSAWWCIEDHAGCETKNISIAQLLERLLF